MEEAVVMRARHCINLQGHFGNRYKVVFEESYYAERPEFRAQEAPWLMIVPCRYGHIYPWGQERLAVFCESPRLGLQLLAIPDATLHTDGSDGLTILFPADHFEVVAQIMEAHKRRRLSEARKQQLREVGEAYRFQPRLKVTAEHGDKSENDAIQHGHTETLNRHEEQ
jgi:hypothetical protein